MKSQKGITMISLVLYVASFLVVTALVGSITTFFYNNIEILDTSVGSGSAYNRINLYFLNECKKNGNSLYAWKNVTGSFENGTDASSEISSTPDLTDTLNNFGTSTDDNLKNNAFITFKDTSGNTNSIIYDVQNQKLYYNYIKLSDNVDIFKFKIDYSSGQTVLKVFIEIEAN